MCFGLLVLGRTWPSNSVYMLYLHIQMSCFLCWDEYLQMFWKVSATLVDLDVRKRSRLLNRPVKHLAGSVAGCVGSVF